ncbi:hypothetical protein BGW38_001084 [Lunasporangiospora selenospora]|uniref:FAD-binding domain-containing protein n=1 Tax=Lunasporangiospora selenospora TaxID=979761 RepID=A0A9P6FTX7_9FUNG|nr:hypothetical protein BGW38_001084 [Lunasporangiospora selenospora]
MASTQLHQRRPPSTTDQDQITPGNEPEQPLKVIIVGSGIGGLITAIMLDRAGIDYVILEKRPQHSTIGSAIAFTAVVLRVLDQLGLYEDIHAISKDFSQTRITMADGREIGILDGLFTQERYGYYNAIMARPDLMNALLSRVAPNKIHMGKKVLEVTEHPDGQTKNDPAGMVTVRCSDNRHVFFFFRYQAHLVIGCDGAYSAVRQRMYQILKEKGVNVPKADFAPFRFDMHCVVGVSKPLDPEVYPTLKKPYCEFEVILGNDLSYNIWLMPLNNNRISWMINGKMFTPKANNREEAKRQLEENFKASEWGEEAAEELCNMVRDFACPYNNTTIGDLIDNTPKTVISKVMLEDKMFETWHSDRIVLLGDGGQGATQAILDAVVLVDLLHELPSNSAKDISNALKRYQSKRFETAKAAVSASRQGGYLFSEKGWFMDLLRAFTFKYMPRWLYMMTSDRIQASRPILSFLPPVPDRGSVKAI